MTLGENPLSCCIFSEYFANIRAERIVRKVAFVIPEGRLLRWFWKCKILSKVFDVSSVQFIAPKNDMT